MGKLFESLAARRDVTNVAERIQKEAQRTFTGKERHFKGERSLFRPTTSSEDGQLIEDQVEQDDKVTETVKGKLAYVKDSFVDMVDLDLAIDTTNGTGKAIADLVVNGEVLAKDLPAIALMTLQKHFTALRATILTTPTLDPTKDWEGPDEDQIYHVEAIPVDRTKKIMEPVTLFAGNEHHPPQTEMVGKDVKTGEIHKRHASGMITPGQKSKMLRKVDQIIVAVKKARSNANNTEAAKVNGLGSKLFDSILAEL